jgi:hypothetical protein
VEASFSGGHNHSALGSAALFAVHLSSFCGRKAECRTVDIMFQPKPYSALNIFNDTQIMTYIVRNVSYSTTKNSMFPSVMDNTRYFSLLPCYLAPCVYFLLVMLQHIHLLLRGVCPLPCNKLLLLQADEGNYGTDQLRCCRPVARP